MTWLPALASALILGLLVGIPYYSMPFYYDYFERQHGWPRAAILLGLPAGTLIALALGPVAGRRLAPRTAVLLGAAPCALAIAGFGATGGRLALYFAAWCLYMAGWTLAGPLTHQVMLAHHYPALRGRALAAAFFGLSLFGAVSVAWVARPLTHAWGPELALGLTGALMLLALPLAWWGLPRGPAASVARPAAAPAPLRSRPFWQLTAGGTLTAAGIAGISQHLKLILRERGYADQRRLDEVFGQTLVLMLAGGAVGRLLFAWAADRYPRRRLMGLAFLLMVAALPLLWLVNAARPPYAFALLFGLGMSTDTLLTALLAAERFSPDTLGRVMGLLVPVVTVGQTWFPWLVTLVWENTGSYDAPLVMITACILGGRALLMRTPET